MEELLVFMQTYGWQLALIALAGIIILGVLKYCNVFSKIDKDKRKPIYFAISIGFSLVATIIYLLVIDKFEVSYIITVTTAVYGLNQTMYAVYETTSLRELVSQIFKFVSEKLKKKEADEE